MINNEENKSNSLKKINIDKTELSLIETQKINSEFRKRLLKEREEIIDFSINQIQSSFFILGKALAEIKEFKLYKADPLYHKWKDFVKHRIVTKLHQSTISDYISIVKMQLENKDFMGEKELVQLGYKKAKLLKSKYNLLKQIKDDEKQKKLKQKFKKTYEMSFDELKDVPYSIYERRFDFIPNPSVSKKKKYKKEFIKNGIKFIFDKKYKKIVIKTSDTEELLKIFKKLESL